MDDNVKRIQPPYAPRRAFTGFHETDRRWSIVIAHRGAGKTLASVNKLIRKAMNCDKPNPRYAFVSPWRGQAKNNAWEYLKLYSEPLWREPPNESELRVMLVNGAVIRLFGSDNPDNLRGQHLDGVVMDEFQDHRSEVWGKIVRPMLTNRKGWAVFIGTPRGRNAFYKLWRETEGKPDWYRVMIRADTAGILPPEELEKQHEQMSPEDWDQEMLLSWEAAIQGAYYAEQLRRMDAEGRICHIDIDRAVRVHTAWDLGRADATAIWFIQCVGRERRLVDYYEATGADFTHYANVLQDKRRERGWVYGDHYFPHDIGQQHIGMENSRIDTLRMLGIEATYQSKAHNRLDGINAVRRMLDRTWIDPKTCERGLECLRNYRADWDDKMKVYKIEPRHDEHSHAADALRAFCTQYDDPKSVADDGRWRRRYKSGQETSAWSA